MSVFNTNEKAVGPGNRPEWSDVTSAGNFCVPVKNGWFDCHYHDCHEYWMIYSGKAKIMTGDRVFYVKAGDVVCTKAGEEHDVVEVYEDLKGFWIEDAMPAGGRRGHLHRDEVKAKGHLVPGKLEPRDFPSCGIPKNWVWRYLSRLLRSMGLQGLARSGLALVRRCMGLS